MSGEYFIGIGKINKNAEETRYLVTHAYTHKYYGHFYLLEKSLYFMKW